MKPMNQTAHKTATIPLRRRAFTLIELLVVISIMALLASLLIVGMNSIGKTKRISTAQSELNELRSYISSGS